MKVTDSTIRLLPKNRQSNSRRPVHRLTVWESVRPQSIRFLDLHGVSIYAHIPMIKRGVESQPCDFMAPDERHGAKPRFLLTIIVAHWLSLFHWPIQYLILI